MFVSSGILPMLGHAKSQKPLRWPVPLTLFTLGKLYSVDPYLGGLEHSTAPLPRRTDRREGGCSLASQAGWDSAASGLSSGAITGAIMEVFCCPTVAPVGAFTALESVKLIRMDNELSMSTRQYWCDLTLFHYYPSTQENLQLEEKKATAVVDVPNLPSLINC
ncbi:hypothetical protein ACO22_02317 [Paracoccidioides brasiliensis]|uniref:Uncharacterized protein n=1 Tax=Paracoccidioides brasiliensis TaxID=121759 RepID=A0A1D2JJE6_PARBR|nr:hypothetical protein ACO22_02317 [Paracoccidioides brasiliensis]